MSLLQKFEIGSTFKWQKFRNSGRFHWFYITMRSACAQDCGASKHRIGDMYDHKRT